VVSRLRENRVTTAPRQGWIRVSPHFYLETAEVDRVIELL
jgi:selenocysteine lyase/cysteine desulfurase